MSMLLNPFVFDDAEWTPDQLDGVGLEAWYDASDASTFVTTGQQVTSWADKSSNGFDLTSWNTSDALRVGLNQLNGLDVVTFAGGYLFRDTLSEYNFLHNGSPYTIAMVISVGNSVDPDAIYGILGTNAASSGNRGIGIWWDNRTSTGYNRNLRTMVSKAVSGQYLYNKQQDNNITEQTYYVVLLEHQNLVYDVDLEIDGAAATFLDAGGTQTTGFSSSNASLAFGLGQVGGTVGSVPFLGKMAEVIITSTVGVKDDLNAYLLNKWGFV